VDFAKENDIWSSTTWLTPIWSSTATRLRAYCRPAAPRTSPLNFSPSPRAIDGRLADRFLLRQSEAVAALKRIKSYLDYGVFPADPDRAIIALNGPEDCVEEIRRTYKARRDALIRGLNQAGWKIPKPKGTMFVWAGFPKNTARCGSVEFSKFLIREAQVAVSPGLGFGEYGDEFVRFALIENPCESTRRCGGFARSCKRQGSRGEGSRGQVKNHFDGFSFTSTPESLNPLAKKNKSGKGVGFPFWRKDFHECGRSTSAFSAAERWERGWPGCC